MKRLPTTTFLSLFLALFVLAGCTDSGPEGGPTVLLQGVPNGVFEVGTVLSITVSAEGADGGDLDFEYDWKPKSEQWTVGDRATFLTQSKSALFSWDPLASDATNGVPIQLIFIVTDESGRRTEKTASIEIVAGNGKPVFSSNVSEIFDPRTGKGLSFEVKVKDQDSAEVDLQMDPATAPPGATFEKTGPHTGVFSWDPDANQLDKRIRTVRFIANDQQFEEVTHDVTIVVRTNQTVDLDKDQTKASCPDAQVITHTPLGSQRSLEDYQVDAKIAAGNRFDEVILFWTTADAYNADFDNMDDKGRLNSVPMIENDGVYSADILSQAGFIGSEGFVDISYQICGINKQAQGAGAIICAPSSGELEMFYTFIAYPDAGMCIEDGLDIATGDDTPETAYLTDDEIWATRHTCSSSPDFFYTRSNPGEKSFIGVTFNHEDANLDLKAVDKDGNSLPLEFSPCSGLATLDTSVAEGESAKEFYIEASGNEAAYHVRKFTISSGTASNCKDDAREPNDDATGASEMNAGDNFEAEICETGDIDIYKIDLEANQEIVITHSFISADGNLDMTLFAPDQVDDIGNLRATGGVASTFGFDQNTETITHTTASAGTYYLQIFNNNPGKNPYELDIKVNQAAPCDKDQFEGQNNHTQANAAVLASMDSLALTDLEVCPGKPDWYSRTEFNGLFFLGEIKVTGGDGDASDMEWEVFDGQGSIGLATRNGNALEFSFTPVSTSGLFHKVSTTKEVEYSFELLR